VVPFLWTVPGDHLTGVILTHSYPTNLPL